MSSTSLLKKPAFTKFLSIIVKKAYFSILKIVLPLRCLKCQDIISEQGYLCAPCWAQLTFITSPFCKRCGIPIEFHEDDHPQDIYCGSCLANPPSFQQLRAALVYDQGCKSLILDFKHGDALHLLPALADWMYSRGQDILGHCDLLVPVPLHWRRLFMRRYNQAALLAQKIGLRSGIKVDPTLLKKIKNTPSQGRFTRLQRQKNVQGAFAIDSEKFPLINQKVITLIDDVYTSGATVQACTNVLLNAGAKEVNILTLARVLRC